MRKQFGGKATKQDIARYGHSSNWDGKQFVNLEQTSIDVSFQTIPKLLYKQFCKEKGREPGTNLAIRPFEKEDFLAPSTQSKFIWYGHSVLLMRMNGKTLLIDPMFGPDAAPISPFSVKRFTENTLDLIDGFPQIDLLLMTHDHYDHLDYESIRRLKPKVKKYFVALGVARHLIKWGIPEEDITEFDWWDDQVFSDINITFTPSRHFSGRGISDRSKSLWGGWVFKTQTENIWFSGDGGYGLHFKEIGERLGPFDFAFLECGQYNPLWHQIHMYPEECIQAAIDAGAKKIMPVHWSAFSLAHHPWIEPVERFIAEGTLRQINCSVPALGQLVIFGNEPEMNPWWR